MKRLLTWIVPLLCLLASLPGNAQSVHDTLSGLRVIAEVEILSSQLALVRSTTMQVKARAIELSAHYENIERKVDDAASAHHLKLSRTFVNGTALFLELSQLVDRLNSLNDLTGRQFDAAFLNTTKNGQILFLKTLKNASLAVHDVVDQKIFRNLLTLACADLCSISVGP